MKRNSDIGGRYKRYFMHILLLFTVKACIFCHKIKKIFHKRFIIVCYGIFELHISINQDFYQNQIKLRHYFNGWVGPEMSEQMSLFFMSLFRGGGQVQTLICPMSPFLLFFFIEVFPKPSRRYVHESIPTKPIVKSHLVLVLVRMY